MRFGLLLALFSLLIRNRSAHINTYPEEGAQDDVNSIGQYYPMLHLHRPSGKGKLSL
jgi:hypothetical protein